ncbi:uncharacterized protein LOC114127090 [Aphis gossypii]|uniref:uncharacterized protein LOC114127090 n=1 Tax=Aphis gossypii TaxID=80765 RepID=UPI002159238E|nr:uncharacterized protein LOC114127090 [Aphis gossypii]
MANSYRHSCPSAQTSNRSSDNGRDDYRPKYQLSEVDHCGLHGGHGGYLSLVVSWLQRAFCCHREVGRPTDPRPARVRFPKKLVVFVERDRKGNVYAVLEKPSSSLQSPKTHVRDNVTDILTRLYGSPTLVAYTQQRLMAVAATTTIPTATTTPFWMALVCGLPFHGVQTERQAAC